MGIKQKLEDHIVFWTLAMLVVGFVSGVGAYEGLLRITNQEPVVRDSYINKSDLVGNILRSEVIGEIERLIEVGTDAHGNPDQNKAGVSLTRTRSFLHGLDFP